MEKEGSEPLSSILHPLSSPRRRRRLERAVFWIFRLATYFILAAASYIFLDIGIKGGRTLFTTTPPFINVPFLTEPPQTLTSSITKAKR